jgi:hypothetical protein
MTRYLALALMAAAALAASAQVAMAAGETPAVNLAAVTGKAAATPTASAAPAPPKHTDPGRDYYKDVGFSFLPAEGWVKQKAPDGLFMMYSRPPAQKGFMVNVNANVQTGEGGFDVQEVKKGMAQVLPGYKPVDEGKLTINGRSAGYLSGTFTVQGVNIQNLQYYILSGKKAYIVTFSCLAEDFAKNRPAFEKIAMTMLVD